MDPLPARGGVGCGVELKGEDSASKGGGANVPTPTAPGLHLYYI